MTHREPAGPVRAFDALYAAHAPYLVRQAYLLTGHRGLAHQAVRRAFQEAWQRWPEVAVDSDPGGWVRAEAYEYALSPWRGLRPRRRRAPFAADAYRALLGALLGLPKPYRRALMLHDGVGLGLSATAAELEATRGATVSRVARARAALVDTLPELGEALPERLGEALRARLDELASVQPVRAPDARTVREGGERRARCWTRGVLAGAALVVLTAVVPVYGGPEPHVGPSRGPATASVPAARLTPQAR